MTVTILPGDCRDVLRTLPDESVHCVVTSPPYWGLRDYGVAGQLGLESDFASYIASMVVAEGWHGVAEFGGQLCWRKWYWTK
jgi:DNA modification methylase